MTPTTIPTLWRDNSIPSRRIARTASSDATLPGAVSSDATVPGAVSAGAPVVPKAVARALIKNSRRFDMVNAPPVKLRNLVNVVVEVHKMRDANICSLLSAFNFRLHPGKGRTPHAWITDDHDRRDCRGC